MVEKIELYGEGRKGSMIEFYIQNPGNTNPDSFLILLEFYTVIPHHDYGLKKMRNFVIGTPQKLKHKLEMVEALDEIEVPTKLLKDDTGTQGDPLYSSYQRLHCELTPIGVDSREFDMIAKYLHNTHAKTHSSYTVDIVQIFRNSKESEVERFRSTKGVGGTEPDFSEAQLLDDGIVVPLGKSKENTSRPKGSLLYNEYIVYNVKQIRMRYVVQVNFNFKI